MKEKNGGRRKRERLERERQREKGTRMGGQGKAGNETEEGREERKILYP